ncbi:hypothetical protein TNIN_322371 [Trichonephila inaurata madagascariensis]|uniref:Uncharacterized protein n=1 Tax=Trichonephila inaurata madagascariensis TaxID=2747483 RepID=A0A8X6K103_9ARAC|nr:hypothetical protein TNIN_322371 [Trichonephila inaurata madagascariensis]
MHFRGNSKQPRTNPGASLGQLIRNAVGNLTLPPLSPVLTQPAKELPGARNHRKNRYISASQEGFNFPGRRGGEKYDKKGDLNA